MFTAVLLTSLVAAEPVDKQIELLRTFRREFVEITPGQGKFPPGFSMGRAAGGGQTERPVHKVTFGYSFFVAKYEVPQNLYEAVIGNNPSRWKGPRNSVEMVHYDEAVAFCNKATELTRAAKLIDQNQVIRLPSEAEWEYVARSGTAGVYSFGDDAAKLGEYAWFTGNAAKIDPPVGAKKPNGWGLYDVHGYLWEWCADPWHDSYRKAPTDGTVWGRPKGRQRFVARGGSWKDKADRLTSSFRLALDRGKRDDAVGLRCVLAKELNAPK